MASPSRGSKGAARVLAIVLAGGEGKRLMPLTADRAKPAVPFGGVYRLVDFALSNLINARYLKIVVLTQYKSHSLDRHISQAWRLSTLLGNYVAPVPAQQRVGKRWYLGSADAIFQSLNLVRDEKPDIIVVVGADHVYRMDFAQMVRVAHRERVHRCTVAAIRQPISHGRPVRRDPDRPPSDPRRIEATSWRSRPTRTGLTGCPRPDPGLDGQLRLRRRCPRRVGHPPTPINDELASTTWAATSCRPSSPAGRPAVYDFIENEVPGARTERDRVLLAGRRNPRRLLRRPDGPGLGAPGVQPLQLRVADLHPPRPVAAGQVRARLARPDRARGQLDRLPRLRRLRRPGRELGALAERRGALLGHRQRQPS